MESRVKNKEGRRAYLGMITPNQRKETQPLGWSVASKYQTRKEESLTEKKEGEQINWICGSKGKKRLWLQHGLPSWHWLNS